MAIVHRCDICGELQPDGRNISTRRKVEFFIDDHIIIEVSMGVDRTTNHGHICNKCLSKILAKLSALLEEYPDDREFRLKWGSVVRSAVER